MEKTLNGAEVAELLESEAYASRLQPEFSLVASSHQLASGQFISSVK